MLTLFWTIFFCLGWKLVTSEDYVLDFISKPFRDAEIKLDHLKELKKLKSLADVSNRSLLKHKLIVAIGKPFVLCITCFASIWGVSVFVALNGFNQSLIAPLLLNSFAAAFLQTFIWNLYKKYA